MENKTNDINSEDMITDEQLEEVAGGNTIQKRRIEQLNTHDSSKSAKDINIQELRLEELDTRDSSK
ncbi:MAG: hypothetical protein AAFQ63_08030 [Cyanobacteria bacterium J06621_11]